MHLIVKTVDNLCTKQLSPDEKNLFEASFCVQTGDMNSLTAQQCIILLLFFNMTFQKVVALQLTSKDTS